MRNIKHVSPRVFTVAIVAAATSHASIEPFFLPAKVCQSINSFGSVENRKAAVGGGEVEAGGEAKDHV